jgi:hypothetical protein
MKLLSGSNRFNGKAAETSAPFVRGVSDVFENSDHDDAPRHRCPLVIVVDLEAGGGARTILELGPWFSAEHNRVGAGGIVHRKDPRLALNDNCHAAKIVAPQERPAVLVGEGEHVRRSRCKASSTESRKAYFPHDQFDSDRRLDGLVTS